MIRIHMTSEMSTNDTEDKGNGLTILLRGGPGTGKTLTAEIIAELTEKPLYRVSCGDIGTELESARRYLDSALCIASIWKAGKVPRHSSVELGSYDDVTFQSSC